MRKVVNDKELMTEYTRLSQELLNEGKVLKMNRAVNSMYESETHFYPEDERYSSLLVALERTDLDARKAEGLGKYWDVDLLDLVVKKVKDSFDDGVIISKKRFARFASKGYDGRGKRNYFYTSDMDLAREIAEKRKARANNNYSGYIMETIKPTKAFLEKLKKHDGFKNARLNKVEVNRLESRYEVINTALKSRPKKRYVLR